jgi:hypothetical protein
MSFALGDLCIELCPVGCGGRDRVRERGALSSIRVRDQKLCAVKALEMQALADDEMIRNATESC